MSRSSTKDANLNVVVNYVINAPKKAVYQSFLKYVWEESRPFPVGPSLGSTSDNIGSSYKYNQRKFIAGAATRETIIKLKPNNYICYQVESIFIPTNNFIASVKFTNYKGKHSR